jgi:hypothetical protein
MRIKGFSLCCGARRVAGEGGTGLLGLNTAKTLELSWRHLDTTVLAETDLPGGASEETNTIGVERLVDGSSAGLGASKRDVAMFLLGLGLLALAEVLDDSSLHSELDPIQRHEPDNVLEIGQVNNSLGGETKYKTYPDPDNTDPAAGDTVDLGEAPVGVGSDDGRDKLSNGEGTEESVRRALHEEEAVRTGDEDERLRDNGNLEVDDHVNARVVHILSFARRSRVLDAELVLEEGRLHDNENEGNSIAQNSVSIGQVKQERTTYVDMVR